MSSRQPSVLVVTATFAAVLTLAACAPGQGALIDQPTRFDRFSVAELGRGNAPFPLDVRGTPPDGSGPEAVAAAMRLPNGRPMVPSGPETPGPRVVVAFDTSAQASLCSPAPVAPNRLSEEGRMHVALAYCRGSEPVTVTQMRARGTQGPTDDAFSRSMRQGLNVLLAEPTVRPSGP